MPDDTNPPVFASEPVQWGDSYTELLYVLARLSEWEADHLPMLGTGTGRHLYWSLADRCVLSGSSPMVKELITANHITDRALRSRLREFSAQGFVSEAQAMAGADKRVRSLRPSPEFRRYVAAHAAEFARLLNERFILVQRHAPHAPTNGSAGQGEGSSSNARQAPSAE